MSGNGKVAPAPLIVICCARAMLDAPSTPNPVIKIAAINVARNGFA
jgi:hypothetical protein